jgi:hypothetical protein
MSEVTYKVTLPFNFLAEQRTRGDITVTREGGYEGPLTDEQLEALNADEQFIVTKIAEEPAKPAEKPKAQIESVQIRALFYMGCA